VVIDGNSGRGNQTAGVLGMLGYEATEVTSGEEGFERAAEHADVELICIDPVGLSGRWKVMDTLSNLRADARTSGIPVIVTAPLDTLESSRANLGRYPRVAFLVTPVDDSLWKTQLGRELSRMGFAPATEEDRKERASHAVALLAQIAAMRGGPLAKQLTQAVPSLISALRDPALASQAARVLGSIGSTAGQQALADIVLDPGHEPATRLVAAEQLANNVQRHGASLSSSQERRLLEALDTDDEKPELRSALASIVGALRPGAEQSGRRLRETEPRATITDDP
jgi:CheY-like chemotaxis protein